MINAVVRDSSIHSSAPPSAGDAEGVAGSAESVLVNAKQPSTSDTEAYVSVSEASRADGDPIGTDAETASPGIESLVPGLLGHTPTPGMGQAALPDTVRSLADPAPSAVAEISPSSAAVVRAEANEQVHSGSASAARVEERTAPGMGQTLAAGIGRTSPWTPPWTPPRTPLPGIGQTLASGTGQTPSTGADRSYVGLIPSTAAVISPSGTMVVRAEMNALPQQGARQQNLPASGGLGPGMCGDPEVDAWRSRIAELSQPVVSPVRDPNVALLEPDSGAANALSSPPGMGQSPAPAMVHSPAPEKPPSPAIERSGSDVSKADEATSSLLGVVRTPARGPGISYVSDAAASSDVRTGSFPPHGPRPGGRGRGRGRGRGPSRGRGQGREGVRGAGQGGATDRDLPEVATAQQFERAEAEQRHRPAAEQRTRGDGSPRKQELKVRDTHSPPELAPLPPLPPGAAPEHVMRTATALNAIVSEAQAFADVLQRRSAQLLSKVAAFNELAAALEKNDPRGGLDYAEFASRIGQYFRDVLPRSEYAKPEHHGPAMHAIFNAIDVDGNGRISVPELKCGFASLFQLGPADAAAVMFDACDVHGINGTKDGFLDASEFALAFSSVVCIRVLLEPAAIGSLDPREVGAAQASVLFEDARRRAGASNRISGVTRVQFCAWFVQYFASGRIANAPPQMLRVAASKLSPHMRDFTRSATQESAPRSIASTARGIGVGAMVDARTRRAYVASPKRVAVAHSMPVTSRDVLHSSSEVRSRGFAAPQSPTRRKTRESAETHVELQPRTSPVVRVNRHGSIAIMQTSAPSAAPSAPPAAGATFSPAPAIETPLRQTALFPVPSRASSPTCSPVAPSRVRAAARSPTSEDVRAAFTALLAEAMPPLPPVEKAPPPPPVEKAPELPVVLQRCAYVQNDGATFHVAVPFVPRVDQHVNGAIVLDEHDEFTIVRGVEPTDEWVLVDAKSSRSPSGKAVEYTRRGYIPCVYADVPDEAQARIANVSKFKAQLAEMLEMFAALKKEQQRAVAAEDKRSATAKRERAERAQKRQGVLVCGHQAYIPSPEEAQHGVLSVATGQTFRALRGASADGWVLVGSAADARANMGYVPATYITRIAIAPEKRFVRDAPRSVAVSAPLVVTTQRLDALERSIAAVAQQADELGDIDPRPLAVVESRSPPAAVGRSSERMQHTFAHRTNAADVADAAPPLSPPPARGSAPAT